MSSAADRNLLFGILALQMDFVQKDQLIAAMNAWVLDKAQPLSDVLAAQGALQSGHRTLIDALVQAHLARHNGNAAESLAALSSVREARHSLEQIADPDLLASLDYLAAETPDAADPYATRVQDVAEMTAKGLRFRILRPHARGGLGEVSVALDEELHREVALKEIQARYADHPESRARFLLEAEVTGGLEHPGIVPVYGLGTYADGRPFYAMRFIRGDSLKEAIANFHKKGAPLKRSDFEGIKFRQLLGRFVDVCNAIAYAHSRRVLHRDLKPGNIMLGKYGETLVVDWGLAKPLEARGDVAPAVSADEPPLQPASASGTGETLPGSVVGTPDFMSPEQASGRWDILGPASDVYSLGATLYAVLTGRPPIVGNDVGEVLQNVRCGAITPARQVCLAVPAALESICQKAMALNPAERYESALALAADVEHWLADEPVAAHREPLSARARRWVKRHRTLVTGATVALVVGVVSLGTAAILLAGYAERERRAKMEERSARHDAVRERDEANVQRERADHEAVQARRQEQLAESEARKAREVRQFLTGMFTASDPVGVDSVALSGGLREGSAPRTTRELVDRAAQRLRDEKIDQPDVEAEVVDTLGDVYRSLGQFDRAEELIQRGLDLRRRLPDNPLGLATCLHHLGWLRHEQGKYDEAQTLYQEALDLRRKHLPADAPDVLDSLLHLAWLAAQADDLAAAEKQFLDLLALRRAAFGDLHRTTAIARMGLVAVYLQEEKTVEALKHLPAVYQYLRASAADHELDGAVIKFQTGMVLYYRHNFREAVVQFRESLDVIREHLGADHLYAGLVLYQLAVALDEAGEGDEAEQTFRRCLAVTRERVGLEHPKAIHLVSAFAHLLRKRQKNAEAEALYRELLDAQRPRSGGRFLADALLCYAGHLNDQGKTADAITHYQQALEIYRRTGAERRLHFTNCLNNLAMVLKEAKRPQEAEPLMQEVLPLVRKHYGPTHTDTAIILTNLAGTQLDMGRTDGVEALLLEAKRIHRPPLSGLLQLATGGPHKFYADTLVDLGRYYRKVGRAADAAAAAEEMIQIWPKDRDVLYDAAAGLALCATAPAGDQYAARAVVALRLAANQGFRNYALILKDRNLDSLRSRDDFAALLWDIADTPGR